MASRELIRRMEHSEAFDTPLAGREVYPHQWCPAFSERSSPISTFPECWFCQHAYFGFEKEKAPEVGTCCYPEVQIR